MSVMNQNNNNSSNRGIEEGKKEGGPGAMRVIVPLQGVVQGRGGFVLGSVIPCALFYFLQLYLRKNRSPPPTAPPRESQSQSQSQSLHSTTPRKPTRSPTRPPFVSSRAAHVIDREVSLYYLGLKAYEENPFDAHSNPDGIIQMGLAENRLSLDLIEGWLESHPKASSWGRSNDMPLRLREIAGYQDYYGMPALRTHVGMRILNLLLSLTRGCEECKVCADCNVSSKLGDINLRTQQEKESC